MELSDLQINKFQIVYKNKFGKEISKEDANRVGQGLVGLFRAVLKDNKII